MPPLSSGEVPPAPPARHSSASAGRRAHNANGKQGLSIHCHEAMLCIWHRTTVLDPAGPDSFALGQFSKFKSLWLAWRTSKQSLFIYFFSFPLTASTNPPRLTFSRVHFLLCFPEKPLTAPWYYSWGSKEHVQEVEGREPGSTHGSLCMVPVWPSLLTLTAGDANALPPPSALGGEKWMILCQRHPAAPGREQQAEHSVRVWHCLAMLHAIYQCCHCITQH